MMKEDSISREDISYKEKITSLQEVVKNFRLTLEGYVWSGISEDWMYTGEPLASTRIIDLLVGLLTPFTNNSNLITIKDYRTINRQQRWFCKEINKILHTDPHSKTYNYTQVYQILDDTFQNLADIMLGSKGFMKDAINETESNSLNV